MDQLRLVNHLNTHAAVQTHTASIRGASDGRFTVATSLWEVNILTARFPSHPPNPHEQALSLQSWGMAVTWQLLITSAPWDNGMLSVFSAPIDRCLCLYSDTVAQPLGRLPAGAERLQSALCAVGMGGVVVGGSGVR